MCKEGNYITEIWPFSEKPCGGGDDGAMIGVGAMCRNSKMSDDNPIRFKIPGMEGFGRDDNTW